MNKEKTLHLFPEGKELFQLSCGLGRGEKLVAPVTLMPVSEMAQIRAGEEAEAFMRKIDEY